MTKRKKSKKDRPLGSIPPFNVLPSEEARRIADQSLEMYFPRGETVFAEGSSSSNVWIVREGRVHLGRLFPSGKFSVTCVAAKEDFFCCLPALDHKGCPATAIAKTASRLIGVPVQVFSKLMGKYPAFSERVLSTFCGRIRGMEETRAGHAYESGERRIVKALLMLEKKFGPEVPLTREEIAELSGLSVETAIRIISRFKKDRLISSNGKKSLHVDAKRLRAHLQSSKL